jgi:histidine ammonia-lyase
MVRVGQKIDSFAVGQSDLDLEVINGIVASGCDLYFSEEGKKRVQYCRDYLDHKLSQSDQPFYGINTGFGYLQNVRINRLQITDLQYNLLRSHACGTGDPVPRPVVALMILLKAHSLALGHSGVQTSTVNRLLDFYNSGYLPLVYTLGSLGASGDLAPLSHLSLPLLGEGTLTDKKNRHFPAALILKKMDWEPIRLRAKEGLALINGTQFMSAYGVHCLLRARHLLSLADYIAALSCDAFDCRPEPFHPAIHQLRPHPGQQRVAAFLWEVLGRSPMAQNENKQVQDPYSFRCIPQVHGASRDVFQHCLEVITREINSVTDNPSIFPDQDLILSGGNFHGQALAYSLDSLAIAMAEIGSISERRTYQLISGQRGLPTFLVKEPGLHSGLMIPQYTAAGIVSQNKQLCTPASIDSIVSSNGQEDHVSMGANAATKCLRVIENVERILAIELLTATQALEFRRPAVSAPVLEALHRHFRRKVPFIEIDRILSEDIERSRQFIQHINISDYANAGSHQIQ